MLSLKVEITGDTQRDIETALEEVTRSIENGNISGFDHNDTGRYSFEIAGAEEPGDPAEGTLDFSGHTNRWVLSCSVHGELGQAEHRAEDHDDLVRMWAGHEQQEHGGTGVAPFEMLALPEDRRP